MPQKEELTTAQLKQFLKEKKWSYQDLADNIGSVESTIKNWSTKGEVPLWAKKSILMIQYIDNILAENRKIKKEVFDIKNKVDGFKSLLFPTK